MNDDNIFIKYVQGSKRHTVINEKGEIIGIADKHGIKIKQEFLPPGRSEMKKVIASSNRKVIAAYCQADVVKRFAALCEAEGRTISRTLSRLIDAYLAEHEGQVPVTPRKRMDAVLRQVKVDNDKFNGDDIPE